MDVSTVLLGVIALATLLMASVQIAMIIYGRRLAKRLDGLVDVIEKEIRPTLTRVNAMSGDMSRAASLAALQAERFDELFTRLLEQFNRFSELAEDAVGEPMRRGAALLRGLQVLMAAFRGGEREDLDSNAEQAVEPDVQK